LAPPTPKSHPSHDDAGAQRLQGFNDRCVKFRWLSMYASATGLQLNTIGLLDERKLKKSDAGWGHIKI